ncbi:DUF2285 domain-containing protein [Rhizobium leguminosarum]|uniref:DNA -binding domain-containing protein n=1 Tax=Rhizobium leguminosarum TaxID=384 RepID=UPI0039656350|nr:DUF2285 domain-containing protein [Rhizobium leguminosarum]
MGWKRSPAIGAACARRRRRTRASRGSGGSACAAARLPGSNGKAIAPSRQCSFPKHHIEAASWAGDALSETTTRRARDGMKLVHVGYRDLLKRPRKP